jgi:PTH1 family peptidyl-tRNA hydrolase
MKQRRLIVGLGNPGSDYQATRHNVGWMVLDILGDGLHWKKAPAGEGMVLEQEGTLLLKPTTYMNRSGSAVAAVAQYFDIAPEDILIIADDADLPFGSIRFREKGSAGGQLGLADILKALGSEEIARVRVGIGRDSEELSKYVLKPFSATEQVDLPAVLTRAVMQAKEWRDE